MEQDTAGANAVNRRQRLKVAPPKFYAIPHNKIVEEGATVRFQCAIAGHPIPWVTWDKDGLIITPSRRLTIKEKDDLRVVEISEVTLEDAGLYRVTLENDVGRVEASARLDVIGPVGSRRSVRAWSASPRTSPSFHRRLAHTTGRYGGRVTLACELRGSPSPAPTWYKDGEQLMASERVTASFDGQTAKLTLDSLRVSDGGKYSCEARNEMGNVVCCASLDITDVPKDFPAPTFDPGLVDTQATEGQNTELTVRLKGSLPPDLDVKWLRQGRPMPNCVDFKYVNRGKGEFALQLADPFVEDSGLYTFEAEGIFGLISTSARLSVAPGGAAKENNVNKVSDAPSTENNHEVPESKRVTPEQKSPVLANGSAKKELTNGRHSLKETRDESPARVTQGPKDATALRGDRVSLTALYSGYPEPTVRWLRAGREIRQESGRIAITTKDGETTLTLMNITADDSGKYVVAAHNPLGSHCHFASLAVEGAPDPPGGRPTVTVTGASSAVLAWGSAPYDGGRKVIGYRVELRTTGGEWNIAADDCNALSYTLQDLIPGQQYSVRVSAMNIHGFSHPGLESSPFTPAELAPRKMSTVEDEEEMDEDESLTFEGKVEVDRTENGFSSKYNTHEELGKGRFGVVFKCTKAASGHKRAAKVVRCIKAKDREQVYEEVEIMNCLRHPKLLQLEAAFETARDIVLVTEYITGGELFERVVADDFTLTEKDCILFMRQICEGVQYMHSQNIVHLDLKPENIMCRTRTSHHIKLIDFGLAKRLSGDEPVRVLFGTPEFVPPEVISYEPISVASDMWSVGVICYVLLSGLSPFMGDNDAETFANTTRADFDFEDEAFDAISQDAKDFISALLVQRKEKRLTAAECLSHKWLAHQNKTKQYVTLSTDKLKKFIIRRKWQKTGNAIRALGRMANLSARRNSSTAGSTAGSSRPSVCSRLSSLNEEQALEVNGSETNTLVSSLLSRKVRLCSDRSDSGFSETCANMSRDESFDCASNNLGRTSSIGSQPAAAEKGWGVEPPAEASRPS